MYKEIRKIEKKNSVTVEQLYGLGKTYMGSTLAGHESVDCSHGIMNISTDGDLSKYYGVAKRVIRHKVKKDKWKIEDCFGNVVFVTNDHSIMVVRDGVLMETKPFEVDEDTDSLVTIDEGCVKVRGIKSCENTGMFDDEYVYDIEMEDDNHTFVANNILVHNSIYASYYDVVQSTDWMEHDVWRLTKLNKSNDQKEFTYVSSGGYPTEDEAKEYFDTASIDTEKYEWTLDKIEPSAREFCLTLDRVFMKDFLKKIHDEYAKKQGTPNILDFELEAYNEAGIWLAKKKYVKNTTWTEPNVYYDSCTKIKPTGIEIAQTSSSTWVKKQMTDLIKWIFRQEKFTLGGFVKQLKAVKESFMMQNYETISVNKGMNKYSEYVMDDTKELELMPKAMVTVQGASFYNWLLNNSEKYKKKYTVLSDSDKLCVVYIKPNKKYNYWKNCEIKRYDLPTVRKHQEVRFKKGGVLKTMPNGVEYYVDCQVLEPVQAFSYPAGQYPMDMASGFEIDYDKMFDLLILGPMNRIVEAMGYNPVDISMNYVEGLW